MVVTLFRTEDFQYAVRGIRQHVLSLSGGRYQAPQFTSEMSPHWLSQAFRGELTLPPVDDMHAEIQRVNDWLADVFPARAEGYFVGSHLAHHIDELLRDIGLPTRRTSNIVAEYLGPFTPTRYPQAPRVSNTIASVIRSKR